MSIRSLVVFVSCLAAGIFSGVLCFRTATPVLAEEKASAGVDARSSEPLLEAAKTVYNGLIERWKIETPRNMPELDWDLEMLYRWSQRWLDAERALAKTKDKRVGAYVGHVERMRTWEAFIKRAAQGGAASKLEVAAVTFYRVEAEQWLAETKRR
jgi:hypothetical protein